VSTVVRTSYAPTSTVRVHHLSCAPLCRPDTSRPPPPPRASQNRNRTRATKGRERQAPTVMHAPTPSVDRWPNSAMEPLPNERGSLPLACARQGGIRICQIQVLDDSPALARLVKRSTNELLCGTSSFISLYSILFLRRARSGGACSWLSCVGLTIS